jgi:PAS domain S-box-containing protein
LRERPQDLSFGGVFESVRDAVFVAEANTGRVVLWNAPATEVFGYSPSEALDLRIGALVPELLEGRYPAGLDLYRDTDYSGSMDSKAPLNLPAVRKDGGEIIIEMSLSPIGPLGGTAAGGRFVLAIVRDVTERTRKEEALREAEGRFRSAFENAPIGVAIVDLEGRFVQVNRSLCEILGYPEKELLATTFLMITYPDDVDVSLAHVRRVIEGEIDSYSLEKRYVGADGSPVWVSLSVSLVRDAEDNPLYFVDQIQDITRRKLAEEQLAHRAEELALANSELEQFAYSVSHDLRTPLRSIDGFAQLLLEEYADQLDEEGREYLRRVRANSQRMGLLIDDLLSLSRVTHSEMLRTTVDLSALAESVVDELRQGDPDRQVQVEIASGMVVTGDAGLLRAALENLLGNAWKFTSKEPHARIQFGSTSYDGAPAYFVRDNGTGFDMAYADKLFGAFQRLHAAHEFEGTGVGLATVQRVIHRHGGRVWAEGEVGRGATFYFTL